MDYLAVDADKYPKIQIILSGNYRSWVGMNRQVELHVLICNLKWSPKVVENLGCQIFSPKSSTSNHVGVEEDKLSLSTYGFAKTCVSWPGV